MRLQAIVLIPRRDGVLRLSEALNVIALEGWKGFKVNAVPSVRSSPNGWAVGVVMEHSPIDKAAAADLWFPKAWELEEILKAMQRSDELTHQLLGHGWLKGPRPYIPWEEYQRLALRNLRSKSRFYLLVAKIGKGINFFKQDSVYVRLSILEQILQRIKEHEEKRPKEAEH